MITDPNNPRADFKFERGLLLSVCDFFYRRIDQIDNQYNCHSAKVPSQIVPSCNCTFDYPINQGFKE